MSPSIVDPQSITSRITALVIFFLSLIFFIAGLAEYSTNHLSRIHPGDDMGGDGNWAELMLLGFVSTSSSRSSAQKANRQQKFFLSFLTTLFFITRSTVSSKPLHLGYYVGIDLFVSLALVAVWMTGIFLSRFVIDPQRDCREHSQHDFFCQPSWGVIRGLFVTGYALAILLA
jgi:hypothetical protein